MSKEVYDIDKMILIRKSKKISQAKLAELSGVSIATVQGYEQKRYNPQLPTVLKMCSALDIQPDEIMELDRPLPYLSPVEFEKDWIKKGGAPHLTSEAGREAALLVAFEGLNEAGQRMALDMISIVSKVNEYKKA